MARTTNKQYVAAIVAVAMLIVLLGLIFAGAAKEIEAPCENCKRLQEKLKELDEAAENKSYGEIGKEVYGVEFWEDGSARVKTMSWYIIEPEVFDHVQEVLEQRSRKKNFSGCTIFSSKIKCGCCGGWYGSKGWHSTDQYRRVPNGMPGGVRGATC